MFPKLKLAIATAAGLTLVMLILGQWNLATNQLIAVGSALIILWLLLFSWLILKQLRILRTQVRNVSKTQAQSASGQVVPANAEAKGTFVTNRDTISGHKVSRLSLCDDEQVRASVASTADRLQFLGRVVKSLSPQVDDLIVYIAEANAIPKGLPKLHNVTYLVGPDLGESAKYHSSEGFRGYFLSCRDNVDYPPYYVSALINGIERYGRKAIVGWHDASLPRSSGQPNTPEQNEGVSRAVEDATTHILSSGLFAFHTSVFTDVQLQFSDPKISDTWISIQANILGIPQIVQGQFTNCIRYIDAGQDRITDSASDQHNADAGEAKKLLEQAAQSGTPWSLPRVAFTRAPLAVAIIGRVDRKRWKKGGIVDSCNRIHEALLGFGVDSRMFDIETGDPEFLGGFKPDVAMIYVGDPERPDYKKVEEIAEKHAAAGTAMIMNLSVNGRQERSVFVRDKMLDWDRRFPGAFSLMTFTGAARSFPEFAAIQHMILEMPKTIRVPNPPFARFHETSGVFLGDVAKLSDSDLTGGNPLSWVTSIREALPGVKLYGVKQYIPRFEVDLGLDEVWEFMRGNFSEKLSSMRLMVAPTKYATYEMVPMEIMGLGVPVVYRDMPQSLSESIGLSGVRIEDQADLKSILPVLYHDPNVWADFSRGGKLRLQSQSMRYVGGPTYLRFKQAHDRLKNTGR